MMRRSPWLMPAAWSALLLCLSACGSSPAARFYTLSSLPEALEGSAVAGKERRGIVAVGPVEIADYLDRPQLVRRSGPTTVDLLELDRWAGSLKSDVARVLVENLAVRLAPEGLMTAPWEEVARPDLRIQVTVHRFEVTVQETVLLKALWVLKGPEQADILASGQAVIVETVDGPDISEAVKAMSRALAELSRRVAASGQKILAPEGRDQGV